MLRPEHLVESTQSYLHHLALETYDFQGLRGYVTGIPKPFFNAIFQWQPLQTPVSDYREAFAAFFATHHMPWVWWTLDASEETARHMQDAGFALFDEGPVMGIELERFTAVDSFKDYDIREAENAADLQAWLLPLTAAFEGTPETTLPFFTRNAVAPYGKQSPIHHYTLFHEETPVSGITLIIGKNGARLENLGTLPDYQRRGFGKILTLYALTRAHTYGAAWCTLESSVQGEKLYRKLGFQTLAKARCYALQPKIMP